MPRCLHCLAHELAEATLAGWPGAGPVEVVVRAEGAVWRLRVHPGTGCPHHPRQAVQAERADPPAPEQTVLPASAVLPAPTIAPPPTVPPTGMARVPVSPTQRKILDALGDVPLTAKALFRVAGVKDNSRSRQALTALCRMRLVWHSPDGYCRP